MDSSLTISLFLLLCVNTPEVGGQMVGGKQPPPPSDSKAGRCSYTFIVPQQKLTGALCLNTPPSSPNRSDVAALQAQLEHQQQQLDKLQRQLEQEGSLATEVRALRKESNDMNSRIAQLYAQLLQEVVHKKDQALEQQRVEGLLLNATTQALQVSSNYRELERKYGALTSTISSQNQFISKLEKQCQCRDSSSRVMADPANSQPNERHNYSSEANKMISDVQRDQSAASSPQDKTGDSLDAPTNKPLVSFPVTKSPELFKSSDKQQKLTESTTCW